MNGFFPLPCFVLSFALPCLCMQSIVEESIIGAIETLETMGSRCWSMGVDSLSNKNPFFLHLTIGHCTNSIAHPPIDPIQSPIAFNCALVPCIKGHPSPLSIFSSTTTTNNILALLLPRILFLAFTLLLSVTSYTYFSSFILLPLLYLFPTFAYPSSFFWCSHFYLCFLSSSHSLVLVSRSRLSFSFSPTPFQPFFFFFFFFFSLILFLALTFSFSRATFTFSYPTLFFLSLLFLLFYHSLYTPPLSFPPFTLVTT
ncbi:hypothetical protein BKA57DRAFT_305473 [Linnemannia elongata]|nr:hypothetical protein BKA57DRAFT_305473 [Linnemannia elongata]